MSLLNNIKHKVKTGVVLGAYKEPALDLDFDAPHPDLKPHHSAFEVASWLRQRGVYSTLLIPARKVIKVIKRVLAMRKECHGCKGSGQWVGKYVRDCITCKGKGEMDEQDIRRFEAYTMAKAKGALRTKPENYSNSWDYITA